MQKPTRDFLTDRIRQLIDFSKTDQAQGKPMPPLEESFNATKQRISLPDSIQTENPYALSSLIKKRKSFRRYKQETLPLEELSYLLWCTQGVREKIREDVVFRNVPSAGNRHPFETYLAVMDVEGLQPGIYRYLPLEHVLVFEKTQADLETVVSSACYDQPFAGACAVTFFWVAVPYRAEWRYDAASYKTTLLDAGHICQNLYLAATSVQCGVCAIGAYKQEETDALLGVDGDSAMTVYIASVGKV